MKSFNFSEGVNFINLKRLSYIKVNCHLSIEREKNLCL